jgi:methylthioribose-1-phosphate isomerase
MGTRTAPREIRIYNPAFDVTPNRLVSGIITEFGVATSPFEPTLRQWTSTGLAETDRD